MLRQDSFASKSKNDFLFLPISIFLPYMDSKTHPKIFFMEYNLNIDSYMKHGFISFLFFLLLFLKRLTFMKRVINPESLRFKTCYGFISISLLLVRISLRFRSNASNPVTFGDPDLIHLFGTECNLAPKCTSTRNFETEVESRLQC